MARAAEAPVNFKHWLCSCYKFCACGNWSIKIQACSTTAILVFLLLRKYHHKIFGLKFRPKMKALGFFLFLQISSLEQVFFKYWKRSRACISKHELWWGKTVCQFLDNRGGKNHIKLQNNIIHDLEIVTLVSWKCMSKYAISILQQSHAQCSPTYTSISRVKANKSTKKCTFS